MKILFAYNSNTIENPEITYHHTREIFENGTVINFTGNLHTLFEIESQKIAYEYLRFPISEKTPLTPELIKKIHKLLTRGCYDDTRYQNGERPGEYKIHDYITGDGVDEPPSQVAGAVSALCDELVDFTGNPLIAAAYLHLKFEQIHPFADGNGRVGRTIMNYFLMTHNHPPTIIYNEDKSTYYLALAVFDKTGEIDGFVQFLKEQTIKTWSRKKPTPVTLKDFQTLENYNKTQ